MAEAKIMYFKKGYDNHARTSEMLKETNDLETGQIFAGVASFYEKDKAEYPRWISFSKNRSEYTAIKTRVDECENDLDKVHLICEWLGEEKFV